MERMNSACGVWVLDLLDLKDGDRVLEIGFGPGALLQDAAERVPNGRVVGIDASEVMLAQASRRNEALVRSGRVVLRKGVAADLPFDDGAFDKALAVNSMQVWPDPIAGLAEMRRVTVAGGAVALGFTPQSGQSRDGVIAALADAGFIDTRLLERDECFCVVATVP